jgi:AraC-like DNA-binding protein
MSNHVSSTGAKITTAHGSSEDDPRSIASLNSTLIKDEELIFGPPHKSKPKSLDALQIVELAESMVLTTLPKRLSEKAMARSIGITLFDLRHSFMAVRDAPIYSALHTFRLDLSARMLEEEPSSHPEDIALRCGFGHFGVFRRSYQRRFGCEPGYRHTTAPATVQTSLARKAPGEEA